MVFTCSNEIEISGGSQADRLAAAALILAIDSVDESTAKSRGAEESGAGGESRPVLLVTLESVDGLPEKELGAIAAQFPALAFTLVYYSRDGEFYGYAKAGAEGDAAESEDFAEDTADTVGRRYDGDRLGFVRATYGLPARSR